MSVSLTLLSGPVEVLAGCFILLLSVRLGPLSRRGSDVRMDDTGRISVFLGLFSSSNLINP